MRLRHDHRHHVELKHREHPVNMLAAVAVFD